MTAEQAMQIGMRIAEKNQENVMQLIEMGSTADEALHGCLVSLGAEIMKALMDAERDE